MSEEIWTRARAEMMLDPEVINLNSGSFGPLPRCVFERVTELRRSLAQEPMRFLMDEAPPLLWESRVALANFLGGDPRRLVFATNVTAAINIVATSLPLHAPGEILITDHEYDAMRWCWERTAQELGLRVRTYPLPPHPQDPEEIVEATRKAMTDRVRVLFFSHVISSTGLVLPAREICEVARSHNVISVIDGAHVPANVANLNLKEINADFYCGNCHKWMLAPTGTGFLYVGRGNEDRLRPMKVSWGWHRELSGWSGLNDEARRPDPDERDAFGSTPRIRFLEFEGTRDPSSWLCVPTAIEFQRSIGFEKIQVRIRELTDYVRAKLDELGGLSLVTPDHDAMRGAMTSFRLPADVDGEKLRQRLWDEHRILILLPVRPEGLLLRVSTHFYNTEEQIDQLAAVLQTALKRDC